MARLIAVWDIDGTLADNTHRASLLEKRCVVCLYSHLPGGHRAPCPNCGATDSTVTEESWAKFLDPERMKDDSPIPAALILLDRMRALGMELHFVTARSLASTGKVTEEWLRTRAGKRPEELLFMRRHEDEGIPASVYKARALERLKKLVDADCNFIFFEDDPHVLSLWSQHGLAVKCPEGLKYFTSSVPNYLEVNRHA